MQARDRKRQREREETRRMKDEAPGGEGVQRVEEKKKERSNDGEVK